MQLVTQDIARALDSQWKDKNGRRPPVLKLFNPAGAATWLIHSRDPLEPDRLFGLCDPGLGLPELGYVSLAEIRELDVPLKIKTGGRIYTATIKIERDLHFRPTHSLQAYALAAADRNAITENPTELDKAQLSLSAARMPRT